MKKVTTIVTAIAMLFSATLFAAEKEDAAINASVKASFNKGFLKARKVSWKKKDDVYFASFIFNEHNAEAAFDEKGNLIALSNTVESDQMPLAITVAIANKFQDFDVAKSATEITYENQTNYYISVSDGKQLMKLKCSVNGDIIIESKKKI